MYLAQIDIKHSNRIAGATALLDTGFSGGIWLPRKIADTLGATLVRPARYPKTLDGRSIRGMATLLTVKLLEANVQAKTLAFCSTNETEDILLGAFFLSEVHATIAVGDANYKAAGRVRANRGPLYDLSDWVIPIDRPIFEP